MYKPASLRRHLAATVPDLQTNPDKLSIFVRQGRTLCAGGASLSFEYAYTVQVVVLDFAGEPDHIMLPLLVWLRTHQREYFDNPETRAQALRFEAEYLNASTLDLTIELDLTERVAVAVQDPDDHDAPGRFTLQHLGEPPAVDHIDLPGVWELYDRETLVATWTTSPLDTDHAPRLAS
ncbi:MAG: phage tail protein [Hydrogenophaga sp.]|uniref:phage tail protein n=1 Tax=Hydrogenophaga sp. TaxID=1904254 RepID=UPI00272115A6|nr:phage tail protein [Hydrogenophaga sp.]MDO9571182.1 phage tail protein [Hydrogenophaga sp.]